MQSSATVGRNDGLQAMHSSMALKSGGRAHLDLPLPKNKWSGPDRMAATAQLSVLTPWICWIHVL